MKGSSCFDRRSSLRELKPALQIISQSPVISNISPAGSQNAATPGWTWPVMRAASLDSSSSRYVSGSAKRLPPGPGCEHTVRARGTRGWRFQAARTNHERLRVHGDRTLQNQLVAARSPGHQMPRQREEIRLVNGAYRRRACLSPYVPTSVSFHLT